MSQTALLIVGALFALVALERGAPLNIVLGDLAWQAVDQRRFWSNYGWFGYGRTGVMAGAVVATVINAIVAVPIWLLLGVMGASLVAYFVVVWRDISTAQAGRLVPALFHNDARLP